MDEITIFFILYFDRSQSYDTLFENIREIIPVSNWLGYKNISNDVIPYLKVISRSEEVRKTTQNKRGQRRLVVGFFQEA